MRREYVGDAPSSRVVKLHRGQVASARFFDAWLAEHLAEQDEDAEPITDALLAGGRRSGKTHFGVLAAVIYAVTVPDAIVWCVGPSDTYYEELIAYLELFMPKLWYESLGWPHWTYFLANGSKIILRSGFTPKKLKKGKANFVLVNEGQQLRKQSYETLSASIVDVGGIVMTAANPPDVGDDGVWVAEVAAGCQQNTLPNARYFFFNPELNPHIDQRVMRALKRKYDPHTYRVQILGEFLLPPDTVLHQWDTVQSEMPVPELGRDVTAAFTKKYEGRAYTDIVGVDVQSYPWIACVRLRAYDNPQAPGDLERALLWVVGEVFIDKGDEIMAARDLKELGCDVDYTLVIIDASAKWQQMQRNKEKQLPQFKGRGSMDMFRAEGFLHVVPPDPDMNANPEVADRCRAANARICNAEGDRHVFADPGRAPKTVAAIRNWRTVRGAPSRHSDFAHGGDALTYVLWRFFPRRRSSDKVEVKTMRRFKGRSRLKGF